MRAAAPLFAATALALGLIGPAVAQAAPADTARVTSSTERSTAAPATALLGRWVGNFSGYDSGTYIAGQEKIIITKARGHVAKGTWQFRVKGGRWSAPEPLQFVVHVDEDIDLWGQDSEGYYDGELRGDRLVLSYASTQPAQALRMVLTRR